MKKIVDFLRISRHRDYVLVTMLIGFTGGLWLWNSSLFTKADSSSYAKAKIINVNNALVHTYGVVNQGDQELKLEILNGKHTGQVVSAYNTLLGDPELDWLFSPDEQALISTYEENGKVLVDVLGPYRLQTEGFLALVFFILLIGVAGWVGVKAILSFIFSILLIWKVLIPLSLAGYDPILVSLFIVSVLTGAITLLVGGVTRKGITAFFGGFLGLLTTCILALLFAPKFYLTGTSRLFAKSLIFSNPQLDLYRFFIAGIFIASSGAVMDLAMDIAAAMQEIKKHNPTITSKQLFLSGIKVGQAVVGTMTTTLLLAYSGGYMMMLAHFISQGISARVMINSTFFSSEALNTLVGSFGLVTVAPFSAFVGAFLFSNSWYDTKTLQHVISKHTHSHKDHI